MANRVSLLLFFVWQGLVSLCPKDGENKERSGISETRTHSLKESYLPLSKIWIYIYIYISSFCSNFGFFLATKARYTYNQAGFFHNKNQEDSLKAAGRSAKAGFIQSWLIRKHQLYNHIIKGEENSNQHVWQGIK